MNKRNYGIDLLRLISMFMVVILHVLGAGGALWNVSGTNHRIAWAFEIVCYCAVNIYGLISGYVAYRETPGKYNYFKYLSLWLQACGYSFGINLALYLFAPGYISLSELLSSALVVSKDLYWYFTAYTVVFFFSPIICSFVRKADKKEMNTFVLILVLIFSLFYTFTSADKDLLNISYGYSCSWLLILFVIGAWAKKYNVLHDLSWRTLWFGVLAGFIYPWVMKTTGILYFENIVQYTSPFILLLSFCLLGMFSKLHFGERVNMAIGFLAPAAFGVYLIHLQGYIWNRYIIGQFVWLAELSPLLFVTKLILSGGAIFTICLVIDLIRIRVFKLIGIDRLIKYLGNKYC